MKKKITAVIIMLVLVVFSASAESILQIGVDIATPFPAASSFEELANEFKKVENYGFGADLRLNIPLGNNVMGLQLAAMDLMSYGNGTFYNDTTGTVNLLFLPNSIVNFSLGAGTSMTFSVKDGKIGINGGEGNIESFTEVLKNSALVYRAGVNIDVLIFKLGLSYYAPTKVRFSGGAGEAANWKPDFENDKLAISILLFNLF